MGNDDSIIVISDVVKRFGGLVAVEGLSFSVRRKSIHALIGPNGSGKTTLFNLITGLIPLDGGSIRFEGEVINNLPPHKIAWKGLSRTFQTLLLFGEMTPEENVLVGLQCRARYSIWEAATRFGKKGRETRAMREKALEMMNFVGMKPWGGRAAKNLPYGEQRLLEIARALATDPSVILLDEPAAGMNPQETKMLTRVIRRIRDVMGITVVVIEHNMQMVSDLAQRVTVLDHGSKIAEGAPEEVRGDSRVIEAYLGARSAKTRENGGAQGSLPI